MMRTLVIGDIHSGLKALKQLITRAKITTEDQLIFLGDYVDGWSDAAPTISFLIALKKTHNCIFIKGNHDDLCLEWLTSKKENQIWLKHGGSATKFSYRTINTQERSNHIAFFKTLKNYHLDTQNRLFIHAGYTHMEGVKREHFKKMYYWDRTLWELALAVDPALKETDIHFPKRLTCYSEIYIGHTPVTRIEQIIPVNAANVWNIDTGAAFKGPLSAIDIDTKEVWQSDAVHTFYPGERGRNKSYPKK